MAQRKRGNPRGAKAAARVAGQGPSLPSTAASPLRHQRREIRQGPQPRGKPEGLLPGRVPKI